MTAVSTPTPTTPPPPTPPHLRAETEDLREYNRLGLDYRAWMPRPKVKGITIDFHTHLLAARHAKPWVEAGNHFGMDKFVTMTPLEEAVGLSRDYPGKFHFITIPQWPNITIEDWLRRLEAFHNLGSRIIKFHMAPGTINRSGLRLDSPGILKIMREARDRGMILMSHVGDPDTWYHNQYLDTAKFGTRNEHYAMWEAALEETRGHPWLGAHLGGNPEDLQRLQSLLDRFPDLMLDCSATRWMVREVSARRDASREFFIRNSERIVFGSDQVSGDRRGYDFLASRWWAHRKLWETAYIGPSPIFDPDVKENDQPVLRGLALPDNVLQKIYHDNPLKLMARVGAQWL